MVAPATIVIRNIMRKIHVHTAWQSNYDYTCSEPIGENFDDDFKPELTPKEMLQLGIFAGDYFANDFDEFPNDWFEGVRLSPGSPNPELSFFKIMASQPLKEWQRKGWIFEEDPHGWVQWYFRYYLGRRVPEMDAKQIKRWKNIRRHIGQIKKHCDVGDWSCRPRQRQALLHWAYDSRKL